MASPCFPPFPPQAVCFDANQKTYTTEVLLLPTADVLKLMWKEAQHF